MITSIRQTSSRIRLWLIAAAAMLLLVSALEASHVHASFEDADNHCTLCQQPFSLEKPTSLALNFVVLSLPAVLVSTVVTCLNAAISIRYFPIRAPPSFTHAIKFI